MATPPMAISARLLGRLGAAGHHGFVSAWLRGSTWHNVERTRIPRTADFGIVELSKSLAFSAFGTRTFVTADVGQRRSVEYVIFILCRKGLFK